MQTVATQLLTGLLLHISQPSFWVHGLSPSHKQLEIYMISNVCSNYNYYYCSSLKWLLTLHPYRKLTAYILLHMPICYLSSLCYTSATEISFVSPCWWQRMASIALSDRHTDSRITASTASLAEGRVQRVDLTCISNADSGRSPMIWFADHLVRQSEVSPAIMSTKIEECCTLTYVHSDVAHLALHLARPCLWPK